MKYPKGYSAGHNKLKYSIVFPEDLFYSIIAMAKNERKSFNTMVLDLVKCGRLDLEESDRHELPGAAPRAGAAH